MPVPTMRTGGRSGLAGLAMLVEPLLEQVLTPALATLGLAGNTLSIIVLRSNTIDMKVEVCCEIVWPGMLDKDIDMPLHDQRILECKGK